LGEALELFFVDWAALEPASELGNLLSTGPLLGVEAQQPIGSLLFDIFFGGSVMRAVEAVALLCFTAVRVQVAAPVKSGRQCKVLK